jgi:NIMA (never in mitosis gene a)-related kinase
MSFKDFKILETIGKGSFASVYKVIRKSDQKVYALKKVKISKMSKKEIEDALNEIRFLASIRHKNIVGFLHSFLENNDTELCIIMEYCGCGDLAQKVERYKKKRQYIDENSVWRYLIQGLKALKHLHEKGICHRDLKVANTFLAEDGSIKIGDMNVSKSLKKGQLQTQIGTPYYMSPEIWQNKPYDASSDIWSLGCMIYEVCALRPPFLGDSFPQLKKAIITGRYSPIPKMYSNELHSVIAKMLKLSPRERLSASNLLSSGELSPKLSLDSATTCFAVLNREDAVMKLMNTIKIPGHINRLKSVLPKPCYPDVRPNSPTAWTVADQKKQAKANAVPPLPPVQQANNNVIDAKENAKENAAPSNVNANAPTKLGAYPPNPPALSAVEAYFARKALTDISDNKQQPPSSRKNPGNHSRASHYRAAPTSGHQPNPSSAMPPSMRPSAPSTRQAAGQPTRLQYNAHGHRVW